MATRSSAGARARVEPTDAAWELLDGFTKVYMPPDDEFPAPKEPGYIVRYEIERISGVGPWVPKSSDRTPGTPT